MITEGDLFLCAELTLYMCSRKVVRVTSTVRVNSTSLCLSGIELYILGEHLFILNVFLNFLTEIMRNLKIKRSI